MKRSIRKRTSRIISMFLAAVMVFTSLAIAPVTAGAAASQEVTLHFKLLTGTTASDWGFNIWDGSGMTVTESGGEAEPTGWGRNIPILATDDTTGWAKITVSITGNVSGIQFTKISAGSNLENNSWNSGISLESDAYFDSGNKQWYKEAACTNQITPPAPAATSTDLTVHFKNEKNWAKVYGQVADGSWNAISGIEYCKNNFGGFIKPNEKNPGWVSYRVTKNDGSDVNGLFNAGSWGKPDNQTENYKISITNETMEVWITYVDVSANANLQVSETKPAGWQTGATVSAPVDPSTLATIESPVINDDGSVTFNFEATPGSTVSLMGTLTDWNNGKDMTDPDGDGVYSITIPNVKPGKYQYKFKCNGVWFTDPSNKLSLDGGNSSLVVEGFLIEAENPAGMGDFDVAGVVTDSVQQNTIEWSVTNEAGGAVSGITITKNAADPTKATITTSKAAKTGYFKVVANYTDSKKGATSADLKLYYTEKAFLYEYTYKSGSTYTGQSDIYTWYNSQAGNVGAKFRPVNGKNTAYITIDDTTTNFGYIVRLPGHWEASEADDREFGDRSLTPYKDDRYTKVKGGEGIEVPTYLPSGKTVCEGGGILFAWRDDDKFYENNMDSMSSTTVQVIVTKPSGDEVTRNMTYVSTEERFTYKLAGADLDEEGFYQFKFKVGGTDTPDQYMNGRIEYRKPELEVTTTVTPETVDFNQNPVVSFDIKDKANGEDLEVSAIEADLTNLGYSGEKVLLSPAAKSGVLYVDSSVAAGTYKVPITITDLWGNETVLDDVDIVVKKRTDTDAAWDESRIYFLLTDRFMDGDTSNNYNVNKSKIESYHGGDFKGLTSKLGYIQELGCNTIWITPIVDNIDNVMNVEHNQYGYHGYWAKNFERVDEHLGNTSDLDNLIDEAARRGIKVMVDIVVNHAGYGTESTFNGMVRTDKDKVPGDVILDSLDGLPDFKTEDAAVRKKLVQWQTAWANHTTPGGNRIAYFRVDTVKHVDHETWQELKTSLAKVNPAFKMIGEYFGAGVSNTGDYLGNGQMDALLDFDFKSTASSFVNGSIDSVETTLEARNTRLTNSRTFGQFLSSHDEDGFLNNLGGDTAKMKAAAALQITAKGTPIVYYGEEINLTGPNAFGDQNNNRYDMQFTNLTEDQQAMLTHYKKLLAARAMYSEVFSRGTREKVASSDGTGGYLVFKRSYGGENVYVGINTGATAQTVTFSVSETGLTDIYEGSGDPLTIAGGNVSVTIPAAQDGGTVILAKGKALTDVIFQGPYKRSYYLGQDLNLDGLTATGVYEGGIKVPISIDKCTVDTSAYDKTQLGTYTITVSFGENYSEEYQITVTEAPVSSSGGEAGEPGEITPGPGGDGIPVTKITISGISKKIAAGKSIQLTAKVKPDNAANKKVTWKSSNKKYATVTSKGKVTVKKAGIGKTVTITATAKDGSGVKATYKIKIMKSAVKSIKIKAPKKTLKAGKKLTLEAIVKTTGKGANKTLKWTCSNTKYATVNSKGVITAKKAGKGKTITITVVSTDGSNKKATIKIKIK